MSGVYAVSRLIPFRFPSASSDYRLTRTRRERRSLPNRTHGIRYASAPKRSTCIRTYAPSETVRPVCASSTTAASHASRSVEPQRMLKAVFAIVLVAVLSAFLGIFAAHALSAAIDDGAFPLIGSADAATAEDGFSTPRSSWEQGVVPTLYQDDPQWADRPYGSRTVGDAGAAPLCLAMVRIEATGDASMPVEVASLSQSSGYADTVEATGLLTDGAAQPGLASREIDANELGATRARGRPSHHRLHESRLVRIVGHLHRGHRHRRARRTGGGRSAQPRSDKPPLDVRRDHLASHRLLILHLCTAAA